YAFKPPKPCICKASRVQNCGGCYRGITPLVKCGMERSTVCMVETNPKICARLCRKMMYFYHLLVKKYHVRTINYQNNLQIKSSDSAIEPDDFFILFDNKIFAN